MYKVLLVADIIVYKIIEKKLCVLIVQRNKTPYRGKWCLPGWFLLEWETIEQTARRILQWETGITQAFLEQFHVYSQLNRDPRWRAIGISFLGILTIDQKIVAWPEQDMAFFCPISELPKLAFDHSNVLKDTYKKLIKNIESGMYVKNFLPKYFTLHNLQMIYEIILQRHFDKRNFRRMIDKNHTIKPTKYKEKNVSHRPATLYTWQT